MTVFRGETWLVFEPVTRILLAIAPQPARNLRRKSVN